MITILTSRMKVILKELMATSAPLTSNKLADRIQVTSRTIRNDIKALNEVLFKSGGFIKSTRGKGYQLEVSDNSRFKDFLQNMSEKSLSNDTPASPEERVIFILRKLLLANGYIKLDDIADELYISKSTLNHYDLIEIKQILKRFKLTLESKPHYGIKVIGDEMQVRFCISEYVFNRTKVPIETHHSDDILPKEEIDKIYTIILQEVKANKIEMSDVALNNLSIHFAIACKRITSEKYVLLAQEEVEEIYHLMEYQVAKQIVAKIEAALHVSFPESEIAYIAIHLLGTKKIAKINIPPQEFDAFVDHDVREAIKEIIFKVDERLKLQLVEDHELFIALGLHLQPAVNRLRYGMNLRNPMLDEIKAKYPLAFEAAVLASKVLQERLAITIDEDEIGYIALHIGLAIFRKKMEQGVKRCIIVCATGSGSAMLLKYRLQSKYPNQLQVVDTIDYYRFNEVSLAQIDFIITTIPIETKLPIPVLYVNTILGSEDLQHIGHYLQSINKNKRGFLKEDLIFLHKDLQTKEAVIQYLSEKLVTAGYVTASFCHSVLERERLSTTSFGNMVAVPHPLEPFSPETFWTICTLKKPIDWEGNRVQFVCLLSIGEDKKTDLNHMYEHLIDIIEDEQKVKQLIQCEDNGQFIEMINGML
ncbi:putative licABCH operon regulator [Paraliobacillus ryukyuensis]|uniref:Lichenan operon transcriptional antiterminator n=2 Tax=Paraliobacillus ryukyuensis TaxID=200904 RepID=A0A366EDP6_9BACI|nr:lichenan operon transcriptional antiterminator [Paraliobacillus ryukyuensis]